MVELLFIKYSKKMLLSCKINKKMGAPHSVQPIQIINTRQK